MAALIVRLVERVPATIAISFLQAPALAAVDRAAARPGPEVAQRGLLVVVHAVGSWPIVTLGLRGIALADLPAAVVHVAAVLSGQAAVEILRGVNGLA